MTELERLLAENALLKRQLESTLAMKVGAKGGVSVYGLGRFPVTLYKSQWLRLLSERDAVLKFIEANDADLAQGDGS